MTVDQFIKNLQEFDKYKQVKIPGIKDWVDPCFFRSTKSEVLIFGPIERREKDDEKKDY